MVGNILGDTDAIVVGIVKSVLKSAEDSDRAGNGWTHKSEFSDDAMPLFLVTRRLPEIEAKIVESSTQPRSSLRVNQAPSPFLSFLTESASSR